ncbi:MAG: Ig-like domain-containing protein [Planctomycetes bacterium]|nr:Ig-like domain-containing protein [Planctomycetota bacterium]
MKVFLPAAILALCSLVIFADDAATEFVKRAKKLDQEEGLGRVSLATHCESIKMWKAAVEEWTRVVEIFPDNKEGIDHLAKAQQKADIVESRPLPEEVATHTAGVANLRKTLGKKWRDLAAWAKSKGLGDEEATAIAMAEDFESVTKTSNGPKGASVAVLNAARRKCKLKPVVLGEKLSTGAQKHADYLIKNDAHPSTKGLGAHHEDATLPGYTEEGAKAGMESDIGTEAPPQAMAGMLATFYHRIPLLHPDLKEVGIGYASSGADRWGGRCVIDYEGKGEKDEKAPRIVAYPAENATGVIKSFGGEEPDPLPQGADPNAGLPITLTFFDAPTVTGAAMEVRAGGVLEDGYLSSPEKPARSDFPNEDSIVFIPKRALSGNTKYHVKVTAKVNDEDYAKEWDFTTGTKDR